MKKLMAVLLATAVLSGVAAENKGEINLEKRNVLVHSGLATKEFPKLSFPALKFSLKSGWGLCLPITLLKDGGIFVIDAGTVSRLAASNDKIANLSTETLKGLNINVNTGDMFDDLDMEFYPPCELKKLVPFIKESKGTVLLQFSNGIASTEATAMEIRRRLTALFGENLPSNVFLGSGHENMLIDLRREMPNAQIIRFARPWNDKYGKFLAWGWPKHLAAAIKKHKFNAIVVSFIPGYTTEAYFKELKSLGVETGCCVNASDLTSKFILDSDLTYPIINNPQSVGKIFKEK